MLPKERINTAMNLKTPDRTPLMCQFSIGHMLLQLDVSPAEFWFDADVYARGLLELRRIYDFDGILISLHGHDPYWRDNISKIEKTDGAEEVYWNNGDTTMCFNNDLPQHINTAEKQIPDISSINEDDLPSELNYIPVSQDLYFQIHPQHKFDAFTKVISQAGNYYSIHGEITSPFDYLLDYLGHQNALLGLITEPDKSKMILQHFTGLVKTLATEMCATGVDAIKLSSPFAGSGFISPEYYSQFVLPFEKQIVSAVKEKGIHIYIHTCGAIDDRLELMMSAGISGIECLDPPPLGNVELDSAFLRINGNGFIKGNIDSVNTLLYGTESEILKEAEEKIKIAKNYKGFILSTACSIAPAVKRKNILLLKDAVTKWG